MDKMRIPLAVDMVRGRRMRWRGMEVTYVGLNDTGSCVVELPVERVNGTPQFKFELAHLFELRVKDVPPTEVKERYVLKGYISDDGLFVTKRSGVEGGPPREWTPVYVREVFVPNLGRK